MPEHSQYGCNIRDLLNPTPIEVIRNTLEREIRSKLHELAPGVDPGIILDVLVDVQADAHAQATAQATALTVNMRVMHSVGYSPPLATQGNFAAEPSRPASRYENPWVYRPRERAEPFSDESVRHFRQEYMGAFTAPPPPPMPVPPLVSMRGMMDQGQLGDCTAFSVREMTPMGVVNPGAMARVPTFPLHSNPTINVDDIQRRRFNLIDRAAPLHPWVQAVIRAKSPPQPPPVPVVLDNEPFRGPVPPRRSVWKRLRENYALL